MIHHENQINGLLLRIIINTGIVSLDQQRGSFLLLIHAKALRINYIVVTVIHNDTAHLSSGSDEKPRNISIKTQSHALLDAY